MSASMEEHVRRVVAQAPPLTDAQRERIVALLRVGRKVAPATQEQLEELREKYEAMDREARARREAVRLTECAICQVPRAGHMRGSAAFHEWTPRPGYTEGEVNR